MEVSMNLDQATYHVEKNKPLKLKEVNFKIKPNIKEQRRLFRTSLYNLTIIAEVNNQVYEFVGYDLNHKLISQLEKDPSGFLVGAEPPFLCGTNWPDSGISEVVETNNVPLDSLIITDGKNVIATVNNDEIPMLINWFKDLIN
ncbi:hypothetical protein [Virgibacillus ainsalahensis]